ncbi:HPr family phosphocarrier protein [Mesobacillus foraminis]|uniref:HPr family phosphocarrier protein n=1 Tax=Mesobacillus foraminis TaxID=279826 RepID=UPI00399F91DB
MIKKRYKIIGVTGFAHPACLIIRDASQYKSKLFLEYKSVSVNLKNTPYSLMELMSLNIKPGTYVEITANGCDEHAALQAIENSLSEGLYIEPEKRGDSWIFSKELCPFCEEADLR